MRHFYANFWVVFSLFFTGAIAHANLNILDEARIDGIISQMTLEEKIDMLGGVDDFDTKELPRLGITKIRMTDGPLGVRNGPMTAFPAGIALGASFDPTLIYEVSHAIADEARFIGKNMVLGPCVNISRNPFGGRNFESFGEDPYLTSTLAGSYIHGVQDLGVLASVKHFALNDQEFERMTINVHADLRTMFEIHFPAFKAAVDAGSWTVMASYNKVNGDWATENDFLLNQVLKGMWNFQGFVVSDWDATHTTVKAALAGLDLEMPRGDYLNRSLVDAVHNGEVPENLIDDKIRRILRAMFAVGIMAPEEAPKQAPPLGPESPEHKALARKVAQESAVLLKNEKSILPLREVKSIAVIGPNALKARTGGGGSSHVDPGYSVSPLEGMQKRFGSRAKINYALGTTLPGEVPTIPTANLRPGKSTPMRGLKADYFDNRDLKGAPMFSRVDSKIDFDFGSRQDPRLLKEFSVRWTGFVAAEQTGHYKISSFSDDGVRVYFENRLVIDDWNDHGWKQNSFEADLKAGQMYAIRVEYYQGGGYAQMSLGWEIPAENELKLAAEAAAKSDVAVLFVGLADLLESEAQDREGFDLPQAEVQLIKTVAAVNPRTIVVLNSGNPIGMSDWINDVSAIAHVWYGGQEGGNAIADLLSGDVNFSGKLPVTFMKRWEDSPAYGNYPGENGQVHYAEGIFVGYRHFDAKQVAPLFPFGFGLSYTKFSLHDLKVTVLSDSSERPEVEVRLQVTNTGSVAGAEVAQVYVGEQNPALVRPPQELKAFQKVFLNPGETKEVVMKLDHASFAYFEPEMMQWKVTPGTFRIRAGTSSRDLSLGQTLVLK